MGLLDDLNKDANKVKKTAKKATKKAKKTVKKAADSAQHTADSVNKASKKTTQDIANTTSKTINETNKVVNQAIQGVTATSEEFLKRSGQLVSTKLDKNTAPFDGPSVAHFATTAERIAVEFAGTVEGEAKTVCLVIDRTAENTLEAATEFLANIAHDLEALLNWLTSSALYQPISNTLHAFLEEVPNAIEMGSRKVTHGDTKLIKKEISDAFDTIENSLGKRKKAPKAAKSPNIKKPKIPKFDNPLEDLVKKKMDEVQALVPDILGIEKFMNKFTHLKLTYELEDLVPKVPFDNIIPHVMGQIETVMENIDLNNPENDLHSLEAIVQDNLLDLLDSFKIQMIENVDKAVVFTEEHSELLIKLWKEPLEDIPFFSDFYQKQLKVPLTAGTLVTLLPAIQITFSCMLENEGREPFPKATNSNTNSSSSDTNSELELMRTLAKHTCYINAINNIGSDLLMFQTNLVETGEPLKKSYAFSSFSLAALKGLATYWRIRFRTMRIEAGEITEEESQGEKWIIGFSSLEVFQIIAPFLFTAKSIYNLIENRKIRNTSENEEEKLHKYKPNDGILFLKLVAEFVIGIVGASGKDKFVNSSYSAAIKSYAILKAVRSVRLYKYFSDVNSEDDTFFVDFEVTPNWKYDKIKGGINRNNIMKLNAITVLFNELVYLESLQKPIKF